ncbi:MAG: SRPBCC family protein [Chitinophagaceae bacterium]
MAAFYILLVLFAIALFIVAKLPHFYNMEQAVIIRKTLAEVRDTVADLNFYPQWSPLKIVETKCEVEVSGPPKMTGHSCSWKNKGVVKGIITIRAIDDRHVHFDLNILSWKLKTSDNWFFEEWGDGETKVILQNNGKLSILFARVLGRMFAKKIIGRFRSALINLKNLCERDTTGNRL